jgi:hypothetical protein
MSYLRCSVRIGLQLFVGGYMPPVVCRRVHVLFTMFGSYLPPVVCRSVHVLFTMFGSSLPPVVCRRVHVLFAMFVSSLPPVVCRRVHVLFTCLFAHSVVQHILCCGFVLFFFPLVYPMFQVSLDFPFLIATSVFSNVYLRTCKFIMQLKTPSFGGQTIQ